jgi:hypothetical protein
MGLFRKKSPDPPRPRRVTDSWQITINGFATTLGELRAQATAMAYEDWQTPSERGLALTNLALLEEIERRETGG